MNKLHSFLMVLLTGLALMAVSPDDAFAKRLGGGKSFGSRPSYSESYRPSPDIAPTYRAPQTNYSSPQRNQALRDSFRNRGGLMGMLGGLALGGVLGAILFGGGFEHINVFDLVVFGLAAYLLYRLFAARRSGQWGPLQASGTRSEYPTDHADPNGTAPPRDKAGRGDGPRFDTNVLFRDGQGSRFGRAEPISGAASLSQAPVGFDAAAFLAGAKNAYNLLQAAWDEGDLVELRALTTQPVFDELHQQLQQRSGTNRTEVVSLQAKLLDARAVGTESRASVLFEGMLREIIDEPPTEIREVWHFVRDSGSPQPTWFLDGIQQVEG